MRIHNIRSQKNYKENIEWLDGLINEIFQTIKNWGKVIMINKKNNPLIDEKHPIDDYYECLSYCDINPKGIDEDCESICIERHLKGNLW